MSKHDQGDMAIPAGEAAHFVVIESQALARFKIIFYAPSLPNHLDHYL